MATKAQIGIVRMAQALRSSRLAARQSAIIVPAGLIRPDEQDGDLGNT